MCTSYFEIFWPRHNPIVGLFLKGETIQRMQVPLIYLYIAKQKAALVLVLPKKGLPFVLMLEFDNLFAPP